jgi:hypothetical protein
MPIAHPAANKIRFINGRPHGRLFYCAETGNSDIIDTISIKALFCIIDKKKVFPEFSEKNEVN